MVVLLALAVAATVAVDGGPATAAGTLTTTDASVAPGETFTASASGCDARADFWLVVGSSSGPGERLAVQPFEGPTMRVPGWADPSKPAALVGVCREEAYPQKVRFTYADVPIDITPPANPYPAVTYTVDRTTAAGGQTIAIDGAGCDPTGYANVQLWPNADRSGRSGHLGLTNDFQRTNADGSFALELTLSYQDGHPGGEGSVPEGDHVIEVSCADAQEHEYVWAEPSLITVDGQHDTASMAVTRTDLHELTLSGEGCPAGTAVSIQVLKWVSGESAPVPVDDGAATAAPDGSWSWAYATPDYYEFEFRADCGDPTATGFRYVPVQAVFSGYGDMVRVLAVDPPVASPGSAVEVRVSAFCGVEVTVHIVDADGADVVVSDPFVVLDEERTITLTAPDEVGDYTVTAQCGVTRDRVGKPLRVAELVTGPAPGPGEPPGATPLPGTSTFTG